MGKILESLKENAEHILAAVPEELKADAQKAIEGAEEIVKNTAEQELELIKKALVENPEVDENVVGDIDPTAHQSPPPPTAEEQAAAQAEAEKNPPQGLPDENVTEGEE